MQLIIILIAHTTYWIIDKYSEIMKEEMNKIQTYSD